MRFLAYIFTLANDVLSWTVLLLLWALFGTNLRWQDGCLIFNLKEDSWPSRTWYKQWAGTTLGHGMMLRHNVRKETVFHELVHVQQGEAHQLAGFIMSVGYVCYGHWWLGITLWTLSNWILYLSYALTSLFRGGSFYRDNPLEQAAYDRTELGTNNEHSIRSGKEVGAVSSH